MCISDSHIFNNLIITPYNINEIIQIIGMDINIANVCVIKLNSIIINIVSQIDKHIGHVIKRIKNESYVILKNVGYVKRYSSFNFFSLNSLVLIKNPIEKKSKYSTIASVLNQIIKIKAIVDATFNII